MIAYPCGLQQIDQSCPLKVSRVFPARLRKRYFACIKESLIATMLVGQEKLIVILCGFINVMASHQSANNVAVKTQKQMIYHDSENFKKGVNEIQAYMHLPCAIRNSSNRNINNIPCKPDLKQRQQRREEMVPTIRSS